MRWRYREHRIVKRFALFPICAKVESSCRSIEEWRWLEIVYLNQLRDYPFWVTTRFVKKEEYDEYKLQIKKEQKDD